MLAFGAIRVCNHCGGEFLSSYFLVPKPDGSFRFILNLKKLNKFFKTKHFKLDDYRTVTKLISKRVFMAKIDLKDAYLTIPLHSKSKKLFRFTFKNVLYEFEVIPFGFNEAPYVFTKIMRPVANDLLGQGIMCVILIFGESYEKCLANVHKALDVLKSLGWIINIKKSKLTPSNICQYLGFVFNSLNKCMELPFVKKLISFIESFLKMDKCKIRYFAKLIGSLIAACPAVPYRSDLVEKESLFIESTD